MRGGHGRKRCGTAGSANARWAWRRRPDRPQRKQLGLDGNEGVRITGVKGQAARDAGWRRAW
jgi:hypothetical protein